MKRIVEFLESVPVTLVGGVFLVLSLLLGLWDVAVPLYVDPAWVAVAASGVPLMYSAVRTIRFSITLSLVINFSAILLSLFELLTPTTGALVHNAGSGLAVFIAALLYDRKFRKWH